MVKEAYITGVRKRFDPGAQNMATLCNGNGIQSSPSTVTEFIRRHDRFLPEGHVNARRAWDHVLEGHVYARQLREGNIHDLNRTRRRQRGLNSSGCRDVVQDLCECERRVLNISIVAGSSLLIYR